MPKPTIPTVTFEEIREITNKSAFFKDEPYKSGKDGLILISDPLKERDKLEALTLVTNCLKSIWNFKHVELFTNIEYKSGSDKDVVMTPALETTIRKIQLGEYETPFSQALSKFYKITDDNLGIIDKRTYNSIVSHSLYKWFRETYLTGTNLGDYLSEGKASDLSAISWEKTEMALGESRIFIEKKEEQPKILVVFKQAKSVDDIKENIKIYTDWASDLVRGFVFRDTKDIKPEVFYRTSLREGTDITKICVSYNFVDVLLSKQDDSSQSIEEEELIKLITSSKVSMYKTSFKGELGVDSIKTISEKTLRLSEKLKSEVSNEFKTVDLFLKEKEDLAEELNNYGMADKEEAVAIIESEEYPLSIPNWGDALVSLYTRIFEIYVKEKKRNLKFLNFNNKLHEEAIEFYYDKNRNLTGILAEPISGSKISSKKPEKQSITIPFDATNPKYQIKVPDSKKEKKVILVTDIALKSEDSKNDILVVNEGEIFPKLRDNLSYVLKSEEQISFISNYSYHFPLVPLKSIHNLFMINQSFLKEDKLGWDTFLSKYHYPLLNIHPSGKKKEKKADPFDLDGALDLDGAPDSNKIGKKDFDKSYAYKVALVPALVSKYNCYDDLLEIIDGGDLHSILNFFFVKFPWQELLMRAIIEHRDRLESLGISSGVMDCIEGIDLNKILAAYRNLLALWDNKENILVGLVPTSPTIPFLEYVQLIDFTAEMRQRLVEVIAEALLTALESLIGFGVRDLLNMCDLDLEEINALARSRDKSESFSKNPNPNGGGAGDPGYENKVNHFSCSLMEMLKDSNTDFSIIFGELKTRALISGETDICDFKKYLDLVSKTLDATELRKLLSGSANADTVDIAISLTKGILTGPTAYRTGSQRFFKYIGSLVSTKKCIVDEANSLNFEVGVCPEDKLLKNKKRIEGMIKNKNLGDDYLADITNDALDGLALLCRQFNNLTGDVFEISAKLPSIINEFGKNTLQKSVDFPISSFKGLNTILREQTNQGFSSNPDTPGGLYAILNKIYNHDIVSVTKVPKTDVFYPLIDLDKKYQSISEDISISSSGTIVFGKTLTVDKDGVLRHNKEDTEVELAPVIVNNEEYGVCEFIIESTSSALKLNKEGVPKYNDYVDRQVKTTNLKMSSLSLEEDVLDILGDEVRLSELLDKLFDPKKHEKDSDYHKKFKNVVQDSGKDPSREIGNLMLYKKILEESKICEKKVEK